MLRSHLLQHALRERARQPATEKEWSPQESSPRTQGRWAAVPVLEIPPASPNWSGYLPPHLCRAM